MQSDEGFYTRIFVYSIHIYWKAFSFNIPKHNVYKINGFTNSVKYVKYEHMFTQQK